MANSCLRRARARSGQWMSRCGPSMNPSTPCDVVDLDAAQPFEPGGIWVPVPGESRQPPIRRRLPRRHVDEHVGTCLRSCPSPEPIQFRSPSRIVRGGADAGWSVSHAGHEAGDGGVGPSGTGGGGPRYRVDIAAEGPAARVDLVFTRARVAVFLDGCFWHRCPIHSTLPKANSQWWSDKLSANERRDRDTDERLVAAGWLVVRIWEHEDAVALRPRIEEVVRARTPA